MRGPGRAHPLLILLFFPIAALVLSGCDNGPFSSDRTKLRAAQVQVDDPLYGEQWYLPMIRAEQAWQLVADHEVRTGRLSTVPVAVIDSPIDRDHPDLRDVLTAEKIVFITDGTDAEKLPDSHGTHVAGLAGARGGNAIGIAGSAFNASAPAYAPIMGIASLKANNGGGSVGDLADAILYASGYENSSEQIPARPARVINMSLGAPSLPGPEEALLREVIRLAAKADVVMVAAAGNAREGAPSGGTVVDYPARFSEVIAVGSITSTSELSWFSHHGPDLEIVAPGGGGAERNSDGLLLVSTLPGNNYGLQAGTSMAAPLVAGVAAMIRSVNPDLTAPEVRAILRETALDLGEAGRDDQFGYGLVNAEAAIEAAIRAGRGTDTVLRGRALDPAPSYSLSAGSRIPAPWDPAGSRDIAILLDQDALDRMGVTDAAGRIRETTGLDVRGEGPLLRGTLPRELDGDVVLHTLYDLGFVLSALQDRVLAWR